MLIYNSLLTNCRSAVDGFVWFKCSNWTTVKIARLGTETKRWNWLCCIFSLVQFSSQKPSSSYWAQPHICWFTGLLVDCFVNFIDVVVVQCTICIVCLSIGTHWHIPIEIYADFDHFAASWVDNTYQPTTIIRIRLIPQYYRPLKYTSTYRCSMSVYSSMVFYANNYHRDTFTWWEFVICTCQLRYLTFLLVSTSCVWCHYSTQWISQVV